MSDDFNPGSVDVPGREPEPVEESFNEEEQDQKTQDQDKSNTIETAAPPKQAETKKAESKANQKPEPVPETPKKTYEIKVNGQMVTVDEDTLIRNYSKNEAASLKLQEIADERKKIENFFQALHEDPEAALDRLGIEWDKRGAAEKILRREIEKEMQPEKTAEQMRLEELEGKVREYESKEEEAARLAEEEEYNRVVENRREEIAKLFTEALELSPLNQSETMRAETIAEMAQYKRLCNEAGFEVSPQDLAQHVHDKYVGSFQTLVKELDGAQLVSALGPEIVKKIRKYDIAQLEAKLNPPETEKKDNWVDRSASTTRREFVDPRDLVRR